MPYVFEPLCPSIPCPISGTEQTLPRGDTYQGAQPAADKSTAKSGLALRQHQLLFRLQRGYHKRYVYLTSCMYELTPGPNVGRQVVPATL